VKVLDFGLAKALDAAGQGLGYTGSPEAFDTPTITDPELGVMLGTAAYMSPEQAQGKTVDKRADIWAFGCVLYEMLTGRRAFEGHAPAETLASVLKSEPDWTRLPAETPAPFTGCSAACSSATSADACTTSAMPESRLRTPRRSPEVELRLPEPPAPASTCVAACLTVGGGGYRADCRRPHPLGCVARRAAAGPDAPSKRGAGGDVSLVTDTGPAVALSPDGSLLAFVARKSITDAPVLYVRRLDQLRASLLPGIEGARHPFFSPDGKWVAFFAEGKLNAPPGLT
jgi:eukaryotic-like serine/threonine-protein kinase